MADTTPVQPWQRDYQSAQRRRQLAQALMQQSLSPVQGGMVGRYYVGEGLGGGITRLGQALLARNFNQSADQTETDALAARQKMNSDAMTAFMQAASPEAQTTMAPTGKMLEGTAQGEGLSLPRALPFAGGPLDMPAPTATFNYEEQAPQTAYKRRSPQQLATALMQYQNTTGQQVPDSLIKMLNPEPLKVGQGETLLNPSDNSVIYNNPKVPDGMMADGNGGFNWLPNYISGKVEMARAGRPTTNVNVSTGKYNNALAEASGKADAEFLSELRGKARAAQDTISILGKLKSMGDETFAGAGADAKLSTEKFFNAMGIPMSQEAIASENFKSIAGDLVLKQVKMLGSNPTEGERKFVEDLVPQLGTSAKARQQLIDFLQAKAQGAISDFQNANKYAQQNGSLSGYIGGGFDIGSTSSGNPFDQ